MNENDLLPPGKHRLRPYQLAALESAWEHLQEKRATLSVAATGSGKTLVFSHLAQRWKSQRGERVLIIADRRELVDQAAATIRDQTDLSYEVEMADEHVRYKKLPDVVCASVQTMARRLSKFRRNAFGLLIVDEADLAMAATYQKVREHFSEACVYGCTATPHRHDGKPLGDLFESVSHRIDIRTLIEQRYLVPIVRRAVKVLDLARVRMDGEDFNSASLDDILREERHLHEVVKPTMELAGDRPTLVFCVSIRHAEALASLFNRYRPGSAAAVHGKSRDRDDVLDAYRERRVQFLCNCLLIGRGVDLPLTSCIAMARPTHSHTLYLQAIGRGTRQWTRKRDLLVIDFTSNSDVHGLVTAVDALAGDAESATVERAKELLDGEEGDVVDALAQAEEQLANDEELRKRVLAKVAYQQRDITGIEWGAQPWATCSNGQIARLLGVPAWTVAYHRPLSVPSPKSRKPLSVNWDDLPWSEFKDAEIARMLGTNRGTVARHRPSSAPRTKELARQKKNAKDARSRKKPSGAWHRRRKRLALLSGDARVKDQG